jgi:hypothetical protein
MEDEVDEEEACAGRMDKLVLWETEEWVVPRAHHLFLLSLFLMFVQGDSYPELCAQRTDGGVGFTLLWSATEGADRFPYEFSFFNPSYISPWDEGL